MLFAHIRLPVVDKYATSPEEEFWLLDELFLDFC